MTTTAAVAADLVALCKAGSYAAAGEKYWAKDVVSVEAGAPQGGDPASRGKAAVRGKSEWWAANHDIHAMETHGPYLNGDQFTVRFQIDVTFKPTGQRMQMDEVALYTVRDGMITEERFFVTA